MRLFMTDILLTRYRLFGSRKAVVRGQKSEVSGRTYPWHSAEANLKAAEELIHKYGYHRRDEELADAKRAILGK
jgi:hypothetical protein